MQAEFRNTIVMFCPQCGQERVSEATSFCSRCGYLLTGTADLLSAGGAIVQPQSEGLRSPRSRGIRMGIFMILLTFVIAPIVGMISEFALGIEPWPIGVVVALLGVGGFLRIVYALMFESKVPSALTEGRPNRELHPSSGNLNTSALPPQRGIPASGYATPRSGAWLDLETREPASVTDNTTKLLEKDADPTG